MRMHRIFCVVMHLHILKVAFVSLDGKLLQNGVYLIPGTCLCPAQISRSLKHAVAGMHVWYCVPLSQGQSVCRCKKCPCKRFFFIMAEGSWVLRCRCKHKHTDHDPNTHACRKSNCKCQCFDSPWVCNCDHGWKEHEHLLVEREVQVLVPKMSAPASVESSLALLVGEDQGIADEINNYANLRRGGTDSASC
jgi:hypothetical protein